MSALRFVATVCSCVALACSSGDDGDEPVRAEPSAGAGGGGVASDARSRDAGAGGGAASSASLEVAGNFVLKLVPEVVATADRPGNPAHAELLGQASAARTPSSMIWTMIAEEGGCQLFEPSFPFCDPKCTNGTVCVEGNTCADSARWLDLGAVTLRGVITEQGGDSVVSKPVPPSNSYQLPGSPRLAYPPFAPGDEVTLQAEGGEVAPFSVRASGFVPLQLLGAEDVEFGGDAPTELRWEPAADAGTRIRVVVDLSHHGGQKGELRCEAEDGEGATVIPASISAKLIELGLSGNPTLQVSRESVGSAAVAAGHVGLELRSPVILPLRVPGLVSCDPDAPNECPDGQSCEPVQHRCL